MVTSLFSLSSSNAYLTVLVNNSLKIKPKLVNLGSVEIKLGSISNLIEISLVE